MGRFIKEKKDREGKNFPFSDFRYSLDQKEKKEQRTESNVDSVGFRFRWLSEDFAGF